MALRLESGRREIGARTHPFDGSSRYEQDEFASIAPATREPRNVLAGVTMVFAVIASLVLVTPAASHLFGYRTMVVTGGSMSPLAKPGDIFVLKPVPSRAIKVGELITFQPLTKHVLETHRVVSIRYVEGVLHLQTKGDANPTPDANLTPASNVLGRVVLHVPSVGNAYEIAASRKGRLVLVVVPALVLILGEVRWTLRTRRRRRASARRGARRTARAVSVALGVVTVLAFAGPAAAIFSQTAHLPSNSFTAGSVNAPNLTAATAGLLPCRVDLTWTAPATGLAPDGYDVLRATVNGGPYSFLTHVGVVTSTSDTTVTANKTYFYVLQATRNSWKSANSNQRSATTAIVCV